MSWKNWLRIGKSEDELYQHTQEIKKNVKEFSTVVDQLKDIVENRSNKSDEKLRKIISDLKKREKNV